MYDLMSYLQARVKALLNRNTELEERIQMLETFVFELCSDECPDWYKDIVKKEVFESNK